MKFIVSLFSIFFKIFIIFGFIGDLFLKVMDVFGEFCEFFYLWYIVMIELNYIFFLVCGFFLIVGNILVIVFKYLFFSYLMDFISFNVFFLVLFLLGVL